MPFRPFAALAIAGFACVASAQSPAPTQERTLSFEPAITMQSAQEITNAIRTIAETRLSLDAEGKSLTVSGTAAQVETVEWIFQQLNKPPGAASIPNPASPRFTTPDAPGQTTEVIYPANITTPRDLAELTNAIRTIAEVQRMFACQGARAIAIRGPAAQAALVEWIVSALDKPAGWQPPANQNPAGNEYQPANGETDLVRVFYLAPAITPQDLQALNTRLRTATGIRRIFPVSAQHAIALLGTASQVAAAEQLVAAR